jgi:hypothetical protein|nr:MAG TPA: hypothetical protein [Caudoviricetes sp.]
MKKYKIANEGCDDSNWFDMELTEEELKVVIKIFEENNKHASYCCTPHLYVYEYDENKGEYSWEYTEDLRLNRDYDELNKED